MKKLLLSIINGLLLSAVCLLALELFWFTSSVEQRSSYVQRLQLRVDAGQVPLLPQLLWPGVNPASPTSSSQPGEPVMTITERLRQVVRAPTDLAQDRDVCIKPATQPLQTAEKPAVYRWVDADGKVHYGDQPAGQSNAQDLSDRYKQQGKGVKVSFDYPGWQGDAELTHQLRKQAELLYRVLTRYIDGAYWRQINLNLVVFRSQQAFEQYRNQQGQNAGWAAYYDGWENRAFLALQSGPEGMHNTLQIARHEMTHAMMMGMLGTTPIWLSEGMAQYLEGLQWQLSSARIEPPQASLQQQRQADADFATLLDVSHHAFNGEGQDENYQQSAAMTFFLLDHDNGRQWLKQTLTAFAQQPCRPLPADQAFAQYPGGLEAIRQNYRNWLQTARFTSHYY